MEKEIRIKVAAPAACTDEQFEEWVNFSLGCDASISLKNPLHEYDLVASEVDID